MILVLFFTFSIATAKIADSRPQGIDSRPQGIDSGIVEFVERQMNLQCNCFNYRRVQIVQDLQENAEGSKIRMDVTMAETDCHKNSVLGGSKNRTDCAVKEPKERCKITVKVSNGDYDLHDFKCRTIPPLQTHDDLDLIEQTVEREFSMQLNSPMVSISTIADVVSRSDFDDYKRKFTKSYKNNDEENVRFHIFKANMKIAQLLQQNEEGTAVYGATEFADMLPSEFRHYYMTPDWKEPKFPMKRAPMPEVTDLPETWDWRDHNAVTDVKNQGMCGSCWAFSTTGNIEGQWALKKGKLVSLSEQELVDCDTLDEGCNGGLPSNAYKAIETIGGLETEDEYPYNAHRHNCQFNKTEYKIYINDSVQLPEDETELAKWIYKNGPVSIGINANAMQFYWGGIAKPWKIFCNPKSLNHGVVITGYGIEKGKPYWAIKNSWGKSWGRKGYYYIYRGGGECGLNTMVTSAIIK